VQLDVTDERAFAALIADIYVTYGRLDGVIHGAGTIEDKLVRDKSLESFDRVLRTKTMSAFVLSRHLRPESLRFLVLFSSVAGRFGNRGQADYAAGNEVVAKLAGVLQRRWPGRVCSIAWAPWDQAGMVSPELKREVIVGGSSAVTLAPGREREMLPLLKDAGRETLPAGVPRFVRLLDPSVDLYLNDHRLEGRPVFPLAFATEFMAEAAQAAWPERRVVAIRDLQLLKGIILDRSPMPVAATLRNVQPGANGDTIDVHVELSTPGTNPLLRYRSIVHLAAEGSAPPPFHAPDRPLVPLSKSVGRAYADWTFHGPLFQRVTGVTGVQADAIVGTVFSSSAIRVLANVARPDWIIDPFVFDAALQLLLIWSRARHDKTALPSRFSAFTRYAPLSDERLTCDVAVETLSEGHALRSTVHFVGASGRVLARLDDMEASCSGALNRLTAAVRQGNAP
jgi:NAD(P)-dependent dehydrogenase (short-subunit alcohol dehydrogenase family)